MKQMLLTMLQGIGFSSGITLVFIAANHMDIGFSDVIGIYFFGAICGLLSMIYMVERIPLPLQLFVHLFGSIIAFLTVVYLNQWLPLEVAPLVSSTIIFVIIFLIIWLFFLISNIQHSKKVNAKLKNKKV
ncbi:MULTISPECIES: DUF3021 domain-containing protein [unclassified Staphylococcus]|uniref:DUF3021 domain-containing protein n=1 Tax=unclassified Staphylococcus TaxID=91994 RepID=UPI001AEBE242|nr:MULTISPECIES: DUF3021 domain-containing protein [unclassified Staphylococcus]